MSKKTKFTPGPWKYNEGRGTVSSAAAVPTDVVARYVDKHNGHLIAAAPEMYEALEMVVAYFEDADEIDYGVLQTTIDEALSKAKARGEQ